LYLPEKGRTLVTPSSFRLQKTALRPEVEIVVFFYSASWCTPCKPVAKALRSSYPEIIAAEPRLEVITYSVDRSMDARADYLRDEQFPWPAVAPELIGRANWPESIKVGTPSFQAFSVSNQHWQAITPPGDASTIFDQALTKLQIKRRVP
jgi:thiol-disulfide isomerase/thioredoxin